VKTIHRVPALWIGALALKALALLSGLDLLDRAANLALVGLAAWWAYRLVRRPRPALLWRVSRRLMLSYILVGAVPILLLLTFAILGFLLIFFDISAYLVRERLASLTEQADTFARTSLYEIERARQGNVQEVLDRRHAAIESTYPGVSIAIVPTAGDPRCGVPPSSDIPTPAPSGPAIVAGSSTAVPLPPALPRWVPCTGFSGLIMRDAAPASARNLTMVARAAALPRRRAPAYAVVVDLPVNHTLGERALAAAGITLGTEGTRSLFNTATFLTHTNWASGLAGRTALTMSVDVRALYLWLGGAADGGAEVSFNQILLYALVGVGALLLVIEVVALGHGVALARSITSSVDELFGGTARVKRGDFQQAVAVRSDDQLGDLAASFNDMTGRIHELLQERDEKRRLEEELRIARDIQMSLLPQGPMIVPGLTIAGRCVPAREVGGDYYDFLPLPDGRFGVLIADVAGKGTSAALYMAELKGLMLSLSRVHTSPRTLLVDANRIISRHLDSRSFITMIYAVIDPVGRTLTCARAGHAPFIRLPRGEIGGRTARVLAPSGMILGLNLDEGERFERTLQEVTIPLEAGDLFFFFTDGISEAMDGEGDWFGELRLAGLVEAHAELPVEELSDRILEDVAAFAGSQRQHDDITMIVMKVH
jgi:serine phosphatase RsbU (regulator of sigma subunit)